MSIAEAYRDKVSKLPQEARASLLHQIEEILESRNYQVLQAAVVEGRRQRGGGFNGRYIPTARVVERLMTFDTDKDGRLSTTEIGAMAPRLAAVQRVVDAHHLGRRDVVLESSVRQLMKFDADKDGKIARSELPERLHGLLKSHDSDRNNVLDAAELEHVANEESVARFVQGAPGGVNLPLMEQGLRDLNVSNDVRGKALAVLADHQAKLRDSTEQARLELQANIERALGSDGLRSLEGALSRRSDRPVGRQAR